MTKSHLDPFFGQEKTEEAMDKVVAASIDPRHWDAQNDSYETKWFGYRFMSPGAAYFRFADAFHKAYTGVRGRSVMHGRYAQSDIVNHVAKRDLTGLWSAMAMADRMGMPYDFYCSAAMKIADRQGRRQLPTPTQLYSPGLIGNIEQRWEDYLATYMVRTKAPQYDLGVYQGHPWQDAYHDYLISLLEKKRSRKFAIATLCFHEPQLPAKKAAARFGAEVVEEARGIDPL